MKKTVFIQSVPHYPTSWGDASNSWNLGSYFTGLGVWHTKEFTQKLGVWSKQSYNIILDRHPGNEPSKLVIKKAGSEYSQFDNIKFSADIDLTVGMNYLDQNPHTRSVAFGYHCKDGMIPSGDVLTQSQWVTRNILGKVNFDNEEEIAKDIKSQIIGLPECKPLVEPETRYLPMLVWFYMYRAADLPIYYIIPNPDLMGISHNIECQYEKIRYRVIDPHFGTIGDLILRPKFSTNVGQMTPNKLLVKGDEFEIYPFEGGVFGWGYNEQVPKVGVKVTTDLDFERDPESNKLKFKWKDESKTGFINIRWNSTSVLDLSMSSHDYNFVQNKCQYTYDVYRK
jgi:hypothetical protein